MLLIENQKYRVSVTSSPYRSAGEYDLFYRKQIFTDKSHIYNFSEGLKDWSVFYNFFRPAETFTIHPLKKGDSYGKH